MADIAVTDGLFFTKTGMDNRAVSRIVGDALKGCDDGELFLEYCQSESFSFDDGRIKNASFDTSQGFGLRAVSGETTGFAHATTFSEEALARAGETVKAVRAGHGGTLAAPPIGTNQQLYTDANPLPLVPFDVKIETLAAIDAYARARRIRRSSRSAPPSAARGRRFILSAPTAPRPPTSGPWCGSTSASSSATASAWNPAATAPARAPPTLNS